MLFWGKTERAFLRVQHNVLAFNLKLIKWRKGIVVFRVFFFVNR